MKQCEETAQTLFTLIENNDIQAARQLLTEDFTFSGPFSDPIDAQAWLGLHEKFNHAFPNFSFNAKNFCEHGIHVHLIAQLSGTHTADLDLTAIGLGVYSPTGKSFTLPEELAIIELNGEKVRAVKVENIPGGGLEGILSQLGIAVPVK